MHVLLDVDGEEFDLYLVREGDLVKVEVGGETFDARLSEGGTVTLGGRTFRIDVAENSVTFDGREVPFRIADFQSGGAPGAHGGTAGGRAGKVKPPMPGKIVSVAVHEGQDVAQGQLLLVLEAMKMQNEIVAPAAGKIKKVNVKIGQNVEAKDVLLELD